MGDGTGEGGKVLEQHIQIYYSRLISGYEHADWPLPGFYISKICHELAFIKDFPSHPINLTICGFKK